MFKTIEGSRTIRFQTGRMVAEAGRKQASDRILWGMLDSENVPLASRRLILPYIPIETVRETPHSLSYFHDQRVPESEDAELRSNRHHGQADSLRLASLDDELAREKPRKDFRHPVYEFSPKPDRKYLEIP